MNIINDLEIKGKRVLIRVDYNVPIIDGLIVDDFRIKASLPTINHCLNMGASVVLMSHLGRPNGKIMPEMSLDPIAFCLEDLIGKEIMFSSDCISEESIKGLFAVNNPNFNYSGNSVFTSLSVSSTDMTDTSGYETKKTGFSLGTEFEQYQNIFFAPSIEASVEDIEVESSASSAIKKMAGNFTNLDFMYALIVDERNQVFQPTSGYRTKFVQSLPIVMDSSAIMNGFEVSGYHDFSDDLVGAVRFYARAINGVDEDVRLTSRLFIPQRRLRGFNTRRVGPKDGADWIGGNYTSALGFEAQLPNLLPESTRTDISLFLDSGNIWGVDYDTTLDNSDTYRSSVGISANIFTTVGPLSFTFAEAITKGTNDETEFFNFRLGTTF